MIKCYWMNIRQFDNRETFVKAYYDLPNESLWKVRKESIKNYRFEDDKKRCLAAGVLLFRILELYSIHNKNLIKNEFGKLYLEESQQLYFNLSHSGDYAVCSAGLKENGIDIEQYRYDSLDIAKRFFSDSEYKQIILGDRDMFTRLWTMKESYIKVKGMGLSMPLDSFIINPGEITKTDRIKKFKAVTLEKETKVSGENNIYFQEFKLPKFHITVCGYELIDDKMIELQY